MASKVLYPIEQDPVPREYENERGYNGIDDVNRNAENNPYLSGDLNENFESDSFEEEFQMDDAVDELDTDDVTNDMEISYDEPVLEDEMSHLERERRRIERVVLMDAVSEKQHKELMEKLDAALAAENERSKMLYAIENRKKNTMDYALEVYGDEADLESINHSANTAYDKASGEVKGLSGQLSAQLDSVIHQNNQVMVLMPNGQVRMMDKDVAGALSLYTLKQSGAYDNVTIQESQSFLMDKTTGEPFEFTRNEEEKLAELHRKIMQTDKDASKFYQKTPKAMTPEEYAAFNRERRFELFGYPSAGLDYDYVMTKEGVYEWNGRPLPEVMSSPTMIREMERDERAMNGPSM